MRLFLFPYAGGGPAAFWKWATEFPDHLETWIAYYPGRGSRYNETPIKKIDILVKRLSQAIQPFLDKPFGFFGYSLGGLVAFELAQTLRQNDLPGPKIFFVSACGAPQYPDSHPPIHSLSDIEFLKAIKEFNGTPVEVLEYGELIELLLPALRADFEAFEAYNYNPNKLPLNCPIIAFGGDDDSLVNREQMEGWSFQTSATFKTKYFPGDHFFFNSKKDAVRYSIVDEIMPPIANDQRLR